MDSATDRQMNEVDGKVEVEMYDSEYTMLASWQMAVERVFFFEDVGMFRADMYLTTKEINDAGITGDEQVCITIKEG